MTNEEARALGERLKKCDGFRWLPGMVGRIREIGTTRLVTLDARYVTVGCNEVEIGFWLRHAVPDLRDPCTVGGAESLMREAWGDETICIVPDRDRGGAAFKLDNAAGDLPIYITRRTREAVAVAAFEAAPNKASK